MIEKKLEEAINTQINEELFSSYLYLSMSAYFEAENLKGMAHWMRVQAQEELIHVFKFYRYLNDRGGQVILSQVKAPATRWESAAIAFQAAYEHEQHITSCIHKLVDLALKEGDQSTANMLQWFINEQVEEEATASEVAAQLKRIGDNGMGLFMMDKELSTRVFNPAPALAGIGAP